MYKGYPAGKATRGLNLCRIDGAILVVENKIRLSNVAILRRRVRLCEPTQV